MCSNVISTGRVVTTRRDSSSVAKWQRKSDSGADARARLESLMDFLEEEVQNEERIQIAKKGFESAEKTREQTEPSVDKTGKKFKPHAKGNSIATAAGLLSMKDTNASAATTCVFCQEQHENDSCDKAKRMELSARQNYSKGKTSLLRVFETEP